MLTHFFSAADELDLVSEVGRGYDGEILMAADGLKFEV